MHPIFDFLVFLFCQILVSEFIFIFDNVAHLVSLLLSFLLLVELLNYRIRRCVPFLNKRFSLDVGRRQFLVDVLSMALLSFLQILLELLFLLRVVVPSDYRVESSHLLRPVHRILTNPRSFARILLGMIIPEASSDYIVFLPVLGVNSTFISFLILQVFLLQIVFIVALSIDDIELIVGQILVLLFSIVRSNTLRFILGRKRNRWVACDDIIVGVVLIVVFLTKAALTRCLIWLFIF